LINGQPHPVGVWEELTMATPESPSKPFGISKWEVWEAYKKVKGNQGAPGIDGQTIADFEADLAGNLYKIWNRMSSGSYFPPPVLAVDIPKPHGNGTRTLGVPTVADRIAQTVVARHLEAKVEPIFHPDSYGYRPARSALDAVAVCRRRCWKYDWVIDLDIAAFFDTVPWDRVLAAVEVHTDTAWVLLYVKRWLAAPLQHPDGTLSERVRGTPQGSAVSPVLANLFMHYALDVWLSREHPDVVFERYADDVVVHCASHARAIEVLTAIGERMNGLGLTLKPGEDPDRVLQGHKPAPEPPDGVVHVLGIHLPPARGAGPSRSHLLCVPARDQQTGPEEDQHTAPSVAAAPQDLPHLRRPCPPDQPDRRGMDAVLRQVLPLRAVSAPGAHQRLPGALDPQQVPPL
jgi:RNA-directed DNA polymerase